MLIYSLDLIPTIEKPVVALQLFPNRKDPAAIAKEDRNIDKTESTLISTLFVYFQSASVYYDSSK